MEYYSQYKGSNVMYITRPDSPVRKIFKCNSCENYHIKFFDPKHDRIYTPAEWEQIITDGKEALYKARRVVREDPKFFA